MMWARQVDAFKSFRNVLVAAEETLLLPELLPVGDVLRNLNIYGERF